MFEQLSIITQVDAILRADERQVARQQPSIFSEQLIVDKVAYRVCLLTSQGYMHAIHSHYLTSNGAVVSKTQFRDNDGPTKLVVYGIDRPFGEHTSAQIAPKLDELEESLLVSN